MNKVDKLDKDEKLNKKDIDNLKAKPISDYKL
jgi:hypothetical protein